MPCTKLTCRCSWQARAWAGSDLSSKEISTAPLGLIVKWASVMSRGSAPSGHCVAQHQAVLALIVVHRQLVNVHALILGKSASLNGP